MRDNTCNWMGSTTVADNANHVEGPENVIDDSSIPRNDDQNIPGTRLDPRSDKESPEVKITNNEEVEITNVVIPINVNEEEVEITDDVYELKRREKGKIVEESRSTPFPTPIRSPRIHTDLFLARKSFDTLANHLQEVMVESLPTMVDTHIKEQVEKQVPKTSGIHPRDHDDPRNDAHLKGENSAKRNQEQTDDYDFWTDSYASDDDEILTKQVSQDIMEEVSLTINEAELKKIADEMLRQRCTSGDEHQYHLDQMKNFLKNPEAPALSLINQDLLYLKKGSSGPEKIVLSLHKFPAIIFNDVDIEERTFRWVNKQKEPGKPKEVVYSNLKIIRVIKTYWELGHEHKFITEIVARRASECIVSITELDYKNLNKNDIEDMYLLIMNGNVPDYTEIESYQQKVNLVAPTISFPGIEKHKMFSIIYEPMHGIIYKNSKKEKRVMRHSKIHKFCDATLNRVLEGLKSYNNDVRLKYRNQMRIWEMYVNGRSLGPQKERPE
ncbi:hypothetical protein Tco_0265636 [Tanacetum coccineum]